MKKKYLPEFSFVDTFSGLRNAADELEKESVIAVDLEADSMFHYNEKVCLLQFSTRHRNFLLDPLSINDLSPLSDIFSCPDIEKIFHGADYDIRSLYRDFGFTVNSLFDTHIAARFLGLRETGLSSLLEENFGINIEKKYQKRDWSERPLPSAMLSYAVLDSFFLIRLSMLLKEELRKKGRLFCVEEECRLLCDVRPAPPNNDPLFLNFKGARSLSPRNLAILEALLQLRKEIAIERDLPLFKIMGNACILEIVEQKPSHPNALEKIKGLNKRNVNSIGRSILQRIKEAMDCPEENLPVLTREKATPTPPKVSRGIKYLKAWRLQRACKETLDPSVILTNAQIHSIASEYPWNNLRLENIQGIREWQIRLFGEEIYKVLTSID
ncbi:MAG: HRDC domain-containing protein [Deltaproteobacteria bacterium]|nr:HRDC domain-containing protein [Deltaproteobacteria bacterium]